VQSFSFEPNTGIIQGVTYQPSPYCDARPEGAEVSAIVVHGISLPPGEFGGPYIGELFTKGLTGGSHPYFDALEGLRVSSHFVIDRGGACTQYVPVLARAWHAGESELAGQPACNDFSVGIELEGTDTIPYKPPQYAQLASLCKVLMRHYPKITLDRIVGHSDIAKGRKTDPGPSFDWAYLHRLLSR